MPKELVRKSKADEVWAEFLNGYWISNLGRWWSSKTDRILKQTKNTAGYYKIGFRIDGKYLNFITHIKVCEIHGDKNGNRIEPFPVTLRGVGLSIDHIDKNKRNNKQSNLEVVTHQENCLRKFRETMGSDEVLKVEDDPIFDEIFA